MQGRYRINAGSQSEDKLICMNLTELQLIAINLPTQKRARERLTVPHHSDSQRVVRNQSQ